MASPAQPPPSPPPPRRRKRSRSPSGERELGAQFDPQLLPPDRAISSGNNGSPELKYGSSAFSKDDSVDAQGAKSLSHGDIPLLPDQPIFPGPTGGTGLNSDSNMKLMFDRAISSGNNGSPELKYGSSAFSKDDSVDAQGAKSLLHRDIPLLTDQAISSGNNGSPDVKYGSSAFSKDDSVDAQGAKSLLHGDIPLLTDQSFSLGHKVSLGLHSNSCLKLTFLNSKVNEQAPQLFGDQAISSGNNGSPDVKYGSSAFSKDDSVDAQGAKSLLHGDIPLLTDLEKSEPNSSYLYEMTGCEAFTYDELYYATSGFSEQNIIPHFGPSVYQGYLSSVGKVLVKVFDKVQEKLEEYKEGVMRRFSRLRVHKNIIKLIGSFSDEKRLILIYRFPFEVSLKDQLKVAGFGTEKGGLGRYARYRIALELAEALNHIVKQDIPLIPKLFTEDHVFVGPKGNPVLVDFIGAAQGLGQAFDSTLEIVRHYGILLGKLRTDFKCANGAVLPIRDKVWEKLEKECIQSNEFKRPSPEEIVYVMKGRMKELFGLTSPMHDEFKRKYNLQW